MQATFIEAVAVHKAFIIGIVLIVRLSLSKQATEIMLPETPAYLRFPSAQCSACNQLSHKSLFFVLTVSDNGERSSRIRSMTRKPAGGEYRV